jgi:ABC-type glycerol-3-phosphate transport system substrate-binding protein
MNQIRMVEMMKKKQRAQIISLLIFIVLLVGFVIILSVNRERSDVTFRTTLLSKLYELSDGEDGGISYEDYLKKIKVDNLSDQDSRETITLKADNYKESTLKVLEKSGDGSVKTGDQGSISYEFDVKVAGEYYFEIGYYPTDDNNSAIIRNLYINGEIPFNEAKGLTFHRMWKDSDKSFIMQIDKNMAFPSQEQSPDWTFMKLEDAEKAVNGPFLFYLEQGNNVITLESVKSSLVISYIKILPATGVISYEEYLSHWKAKGAQVVDASEIENGAIIVQAEDTYYKSSSMLLPVNDRTSPKTVPYHPSNIVLNTIGGSTWSDLGLSLTWEINVPKKGLYKLGTRFLQADNRDFYSIREIKINGNIPFEEAGIIKFFYDSEFQMDYFGNDTGAYYFNFEEGSNLITMTVALGDLAYASKQTTISVKNLNSLYRRITAVTGSKPDMYRDYNIISSIPDFIEILETEYYRLSLVMESLGDTIDHSTKTQEIAKMLLQFEKIIQKPDSISKELNTFNNNITAVSEWMLALGTQPLQLDYLLVCGENYELVEAEGNFFENATHGVRAFIGSFTNDYEVTTISKEDKKKSIDVWITSSRDQYEIAQRMVDHAFSDSDFSVKLQIVTADTVMPASLTGNGPDVVIQTDYSMPTNFAFRKAAYDLTQFEDFEEIADEFSPAAMEFFEHEGGYYALPDQMSFPVMFCRTDILEEMGLEIPDTWDELISLVPYLQSANMQIYFVHYNSLLGGTTSSTANPGSSVFLSMLYQNGEELYRDGGRMTNLDSYNSLMTFKKWTEFYTKQGFELWMNVQTRFRTGETPIMIADYTVVNTINVAAPEINGDWTIAPIPGTLQPDGTLDRSVASMVGSSFIIRTKVEKKGTSKEAWEFLKWWTSKETQVEYAQEMAGILGDAANFPISNLEAVKEIATELGYGETIDETIAWMRGIPQMPGGYITGRNVENALYSVINDKLNPVDILYSKIRYINTEISNKRKEFGLVE